MARFTDFRREIADKMGILGKSSGFGHFIIPRICGIGSEISSLDSVLTVY